MRGKGLISPEKQGYGINKIGMNDDNLLDDPQEEDEDERPDSSGSVGSQDAEDKNPTEQINLQHLMELKEKFKEIDEDESGALDEEEFVAAFGDVLGKDMSSKQLQQLFMRIDANSDGSIDWEEFMNYILLENETLAMMRSETCEYINPKIPDPTSSMKTNAHKDMITQILWQPESLSSDHERYITSSRDGSVKIWNANTNALMNTINVTKNWCNCIAYLKSANPNYPSERLAVGTTDRSIAFYDLLKSNDYMVHPVSKIGDLRGSPMSMEAINLQTTQDALLVGDDQGYLTMYKVQDNWHICNRTMPCHADEIKQDQLDYLGKREQDSKGQKWSWRDTRHTKDVNVKVHKMEKVEILETKLHDGWINKVEFVNELNAIMTCSLDSKLTRFDPEANWVAETYTHHKKGVLSFAWCYDFKFMASCGEERHITLWNPYTKSSAITYLYGHNSAVQDVVLNEDKFQLISLGTDKVIKVWDVRNYRCMQTIIDTTQYRPENRLTGLLFNKNVNSLILTSKKINIWPFRAQEEMVTSHECTVTQAKFNKNFNSIISTDENSTVCVWDVEDGKLLFKFVEAHGKSRINYCCFDASGRRLITGAHDGSVKVWNFSNGQCLKELDPMQEPKEVTGITFVGDENSNKLQHFLTVGWDKHIYLWPDDGELVSTYSKRLPKSGQQGHTDDILCVVFCQAEKLVFTGGHLGQLIGWHHETGFIKCYFHDFDATMIAEGKEPRAVEGLLYASEQGWLCSVTADGQLRFWDVGNLQFMFKTKAGHYHVDSLTACSLSPCATRIGTCDAGGNMKLWDCEGVTIGDRDASNVSEIYFQNIHNGAVNSLDIFQPDDHDQMYFTTSGNDKYVKLYKIDGTYVGHFGSGNRWVLNTIESNGEFHDAVKPPSYISSRAKGFHRQVEAELSPRDSTVVSDDEEEAKRQRDVKWAREFIAKKEKLNMKKNKVFNTIDVGRYKEAKVSTEFSEFYALNTGLKLDRERPHMKQHDIEAEKKKLNKQNKERKS